jgi:hypothetical protein
MFGYFIIVYQQTGNLQVKESVHHQMVILVSVVFGGMAALQTMPQHHQQTVAVTSAVSLSFIGNGYPIVFVRTICSQVFFLISFWLRWCPSLPLTRWI